MRISVSTAAIFSALLGWRLNPNMMAGGVELAYSKEKGRRSERCRDRGRWCWSKGSRGFQDFCYCDNKVPGSRAIMMFACLPGPNEFGEARAERKIKADWPKLSLGPWQFPYIVHPEKKKAVRGRGEIAGCEKAAEMMSTQRRPRSAPSRYQP